MPLTIKFIGVGRGKRSWETEIPALQYIYLAREVRKKARIVSPDLQFDYNYDNGLGKILVDSKVVGEWRIVS